MLLVVGLLAGACSSPQNTSTQPSPTASASAAASPSISISPGAESPVPAQILSPAPDLPVANLCSTQITVTANGNADGTAPGTHETCAEGQGGGNITGGTNTATGVNLTTSPFTFNREIGRAHV